MRPVNNALNFGTIAVSDLNPVVNANLNSVAQWATDIVRASFEVVATGNAAGSIQVRVSNDQAVGLPANQFQPTNWNLIGSAVTVSGAGVYLIPLFESSYEYLELLYTDSSGGTSTGRISGRIKAMSL